MKMSEKLNENEHKVLKAMIKQAWGETHGEFGFTTMIKVKGLSKNQIAGYISDLEKKGYIAIYHEFNQFMLKKKVEKVFENVKVESDYFTLK